MAYRKWTTAPLKCRHSNLSTQVQKNSKECIGVILSFTQWSLWPCSADSIACDPWILALLAILASVWSNPSAPAMHRQRSQHSIIAGQSLPALCPLPQPALLYFFTGAVTCFDIPLSPTAPELKATEGTNHAVWEVYTPLPETVRAPTFSSTEPLQPLPSSSTTELHQQARANRLLPYAATVQETLQSKLTPLKKRKRRRRAKKRERSLSVTVQGGTHVHPGSKPSRRLR